MKSIGVYIIRPKGAPSNIKLSRATLAFIVIVTVCKTQAPSPDTLSVTKGRQQGAPFSIIKFSAFSRLGERMVSVSAPVGSIVQFERNITVNARVPSHYSQSVSTKTLKAYPVIRRIQSYWIGAQPGTNAVTGRSHALLVRVYDPATSVRSSILEPSI